MTLCKSWSCDTRVRGRVHTSLFKLKKKSLVEHKSPSEPFSAQHVHFISGNFIWEGMWGWVLVRGGVSRLISFAIVAPCDGSEILATTMITLTTGTPACLRFMMFYFHNISQLRLISVRFQPAFLEILALTYGPGPFSKSNMFQDQIWNAHCSRSVLAIICFWSSVLFKTGPGAYLTQKICSRLLMVRDRMILKWSIWSRTISRGQNLQKAFNFQINED